MVEAHFNPNGCTLEDVAEHFNLTRERVRQIEETAIVKLQRYARVHGKRTGLDGLPTSGISLAEQFEEVAE